MFVDEKIYTQWVLATQEKFSVADVQLVCSQLEMNSKTRSIYKQLDFIVQVGTWNTILFGLYSMFALWARS